MRLIPSDPDIQTILTRIDDGSLDLQPGFQRGVVWSRAKQRLLVDSILRNWYVPPIHVVRTESDEQQVLDGQQRLRSIADFRHGHFTVDGRTEPHSQEVATLGGLRYTELPEQPRRRFDRFTLRMFELVDYEPEEPYELFYRLNQPTTLTSAEKRNAFFGTPREQIKALTEMAEARGMLPERIGFSNARLAYEDVIARFVWTLEAGTLAEKVTATRITERYRRSDAFSDKVLDVARDALSRFFSGQALDQEEIRLNKATAHSWLLFVARALFSRQELTELDRFVTHIESTRTRARHMQSDRLSSSNGSVARVLLPILNDRASARVNDVTSVVLRDVILWTLYTVDGFGRGTRGIEHLADAAARADSPQDAEDLLLAAAAEADWEKLR
jgi:hypothetical protein